MSKQRAKGTAAESRIVTYLRERGLRADRIPRTGRNDQGDVAVNDVVVEVKDCVRVELACWLDEAKVEAVNRSVATGVVHVPAVWFKRRGKGSPGDWYVLLDGSTFVDLIG